MIYDGSPSRSLPVVVATVRHNLEARRRCLYFNGPAMIAGLRSLLYAAGTDVEREVERGSLVMATEEGHLVDGRFVVDTMIETLEAAVAQALADGYTGLFATGDMTWEFGQENDFGKLVEYELQLEQLFARQPALSGICQYHRDLLPPEAVREGVVSHEGLFINATLTQLNPLYVPARSPAERRRAAVPELDAAIAHLPKPEL